MKRLSHTLILILATVLAATAQETKLSGHVADSPHKPVFGASISILDSYDGTTSDSLGNFHFTTTDTGMHTLRVSFMGYKNWEQPVILTGTPLLLQVQLKDEPNELSAVVITAGNFEASDEKKVTILKPLDIVTTASANADVSSAMKTLPGTQQVGESAELFVRGGEGYETRQFIDGTTVANPYYGQAPDIASRGRFSPFLFKGTVFSTGGYSALYGQALSSALILESIDLPERSEAGLSASPIFIGSQYQHLAKNKRSSWGASLDYTNLALYFKAVHQRPDYFHAPEVGSGSANFRFRTSSTGMLKFYTSYAVNKLGLRNPDIDIASLKNAFSLKNTNLYTNASYRERLANRLKLNLGMSYSRNVDDISQQVQDESNNDVHDGLPWYVAAKNYSVYNNGQLFQLKGVLDYKLKGLSSIKAGAEFWNSTNENQYKQYKSILNDNLSAAFAEGDIYLTNNLALRGGLRWEHSSLLQQSGIAPRAAIAYKLGKGEQLSADYGIFYQKPLNQYLLLRPDLKNMRADHYIFTYQKITSSRVFRSQIFYKQYKQLIKVYPDTNSNGNGYAKGVELFWRDKTTFRNFDYWITYSYLDTKRNYLNFPYEMQPSFAAKHTANLVVKKFISKINTQFNLNYQFATGRPYYDIAYNASAGNWQVRDQGTTISYNNLSLSVNYLTNIGKAFGVVVFSVNNVLNSKQVYNYNYSFDGANKVAVVPPANRFIFLGIFLSWGTDRSQDAINNNL